MNQCCDLKKETKQLAKLISILFAEFVFVQFVAFVQTKIMSNLSVESVSSQKSPLSNSPKSPWAAAIDSEKSKKYDRQLRLWGDQGQSRIERARVCVVNANVLGTEVLKSLVLPGIGSFTLVDSAKVNHEDSCNFFVTKNSLGESRSKVCTKLLTELNPDVRGDHIEESLEGLLDHNSQLFSNFSVVIACNVWQESSLVRLSKLLWKFNVPLIVCYSLGFIGSIQLQIKEHPIIESHPDYVLEDLRLDDPFPGKIVFLLSRFFC